MITLATAVAATSLIAHTPPASRIWSEAEFRFTNPPRALTVRGEAKVACVLDKAGGPAECRVVETSSPEVGHAAMTVARRIRVAQWSDAPRQGDTVEFTVRGQ